MWSRSEQDSDFLRRFESFEIQAGSFHHRDHLRLAYIYLTEAAPTEALDRLRKSLKGFLDHHGVDPAKYHETVTQAWILAVHHFMHRTESAESFDDFISAQPALLDTKIMESHYSKAVLDSDTARKSFVDPDREPIPRHRR